MCCRYEIREIWHWWVKYADVTGNCVEENIYERHLRGLFTI